jgi:hypothetical protein
MRYVEDENEEEEEEEEEDDDDDDGMMKPIRLDEGEGWAAIISSLSPSTPPSLLFPAEVCGEFAATAAAVAVDGARPCRSEKS